MTVLILLLCDSWQVVYGQGVLDQLHNYDLIRYEVEAEPRRRGLHVDCRLALRVERTGPLRFLLSRNVEGLSVEIGGRSVRASLDEGGFGTVLRFVAGRREGVPRLLTVDPEPPPREGDEVVLHLRYLWNPRGKGLAYAGAGGVQTHLVSFWLPGMADEFFDATVRVRTDLPAVASGERQDAPQGIRAFRSTRPLQLICLVAGEFAVHRRDVRGRALELYRPRGIRVDADAILDDLALVLERLEQWFGPALDLGFKLVIEPRPRPSPSYCAGGFAVVHRATLPESLGRERWLAHLAHECSHVWWGHKVASPVVGRGGTWLREGLAEWSGIKVAGALLGEKAERALFRACFRGYFSRIDLRRSAREAGVVFANEATLIDATYLDDLAVPYLRGALVHRTLEHALGTDRYLSTLKAFAAANAYRFVDADDYASALGTAPETAYYAGTSRLPDFALEKVEAGPSSLRARVRCLDPAWPGGTLPCMIETTAGPVRVEIEIRDGEGLLDWKGKGAPLRVEIDPERIHLDPVRSNSVWPGYR